ncbi:MAG: serine/threonine-protein kinase [Anaerolineae bacterium]
MTTPLPPKTVLQDRYRIVELIGLGGMGAVYLTEDLHLREKRFALKEISYSAHTDPQVQSQLREQFHREAIALANLDHLNLPKVFDYFSQDGRDYLVMDYIEGPNLKELLDQARKRGQLLAESQVLEWADQICAALIYLHAHIPPIIHRDVKPANVKLTSDNVIKLVDFGLVKFFDFGDPSTITLVRGVGTPTYAPMEQYGAGTGRTDARSDIYSLGATLYHLLTGRAPADAQQRFLEPESLPGPRSLNPSISSLTEYLVLKAMTIRPDDRYQTIQEMRKDLTMARSLSLGRRTQDRLALIWSSLVPHKWLSLGVLALFLLALLMTIAQPEPIF